jgi:catechol 2,3-dioxygenase
MTAQETGSPAFSIDPATEVGHVSLSVADLERAVAFYTGAMGLAVLDQTESAATLGVAGTPLLLLTARPGARPWPTDGVTGLYHFAILVPTRADLGRWLRHWLDLGYPLPGQGDHLVSEALYIRDPDEHGIEVYRDRPRDTWTWVNGRVRMASDPIDIEGLLAEAAREDTPWSGLPAGTRLGHIHLQVADIERARDFYHGVLGFDVVAQLSSALFVSAGGYHHHIGANTWHSRAASAAPADTAQLQFFTVDLPDDSALSTVLERVRAAGLSVDERAGGATVRDPDGNRLLLRSGA